MVSLTTPLPALPAPYLRQVLAHPDDDGPRLVAADWWDEQGAAERAEFVRVQCELARRYPGWSGVPAMGSLGAGGPYAELRRRERELLAGSRGKWFEFPITWYVGIDPIPVGAHGFQYRRGFFEIAALTAADFLACADALLAACPLRRVRLTTRPELSFGEVIYRNRSDETLGPGGYVRSATWDVLAGGELRRFNLQVTISGRECRRDGEAHLLYGEAHLLSVFEARVSGARTVEGYFKARWPGIDFEMPAVEFRPGSLSPLQLPLTTDGGPALANSRNLIRVALL
jgi:uncharacterized protein (TIGR02996 family)